jgi:hypothetical protein
MFVPLLWELFPNETHEKDTLPYLEVICESHVASLEPT